MAQMLELPEQVPLHSPLAIAFRILASRGRGETRGGSAARLQTGAGAQARVSAGSRLRFRRVAFAAAIECNNCYTLILDSDVPPVRRQHRFGCPRTAI